MKQSILRWGISTIAAAIGALRRHRCKIVTPHTCQKLPVGIVPLDKPYGYPPK